ncbi:hypothetical protein QBC47DRAFT_207695 [Echria macrotheca]|uniref:Uncharacterized protein n=1 Tax=Echria macrotheca TaxID=438768 RepID=A0AAJ0F5Y1_9PEZI|nr:hypothetical protein QBC47DRAFT_207695 [Echria macrotheca]
MDSIMFSPYGYGPLPPAAMAEIQKKTLALRSGNFQAMLELGKKKPETTQIDHTSPPSSPPPLDSEDSQSQSLQVRRAESQSQQQNALMLKAARRSVLLPALSIAIPPPAVGGKRARAREVDTETETEKGSEQGASNEAGAGVDPVQKQVKFLAPDEDEMSDQSSICQSPSWEGYGKRKKEKKKEAEKRRKEKERAEKEAKAAKKRLAARLSKSPPPDIGRSSRSGGLTNADRSMSDPVLINQYLLPEIQSPTLPKDVERTISADNLHQLHNQQPAMAEVLSDSASTGRRFVGGVKLDREREAAFQNQLTNNGHPSHYVQGDERADYHQYPHSPPPDGSIPSSHPSSPSFPTRQDLRPGREMFPPSASRTPMLRQMSAPANARGNGLFQGASKIFRARDGKSNGDAEFERGRNRDGYVQPHREGSTERSLAEVAYEQLVNTGNFHPSSTRSSSRGTQNTRRSSFTQEARSVALKLAGIRTTPAAKEDPKRTSIHNDYFNYPEHAGEPSEAAQSQHRDGSFPLSEVDLPHRTHPYRDGVVFHDRPPTAQSSVSSSNPSVSGSAPSNQSKKSRSLKDAAKAALHISRSGPPSPGLNRSNAATDYTTFRGRVESHASSPEERTAPPVALPSIPQATHNSTANDNHSSETSSSSAKPSTAAKTEVDAHVASRVSEGSSSSSAYEDGSPLPSPVTTPDTSRPQSSKDVPFTVKEIKDSQKTPTPQDDDATLRQSSEGSSTSSTPRLIKSENRESDEMTDEDRWSRTAMPIEIDSETQHFESVDALDNIDEALANASAALQMPIQMRPQPSMSQSNPNISSQVSKGHSPPNTSPLSDAGSDESVEPTISIPPRSKRRELVAGRSPTSPDMSSPERRARDYDYGSISRDVLDQLEGSQEQTADTQRRGAKRDRNRRKQTQRQDGPSEMEGMEARRQRSAGRMASAEEEFDPLNRSMTPDERIVSDRDANPYALPTNNPYLAEFPGTKPQFATARPPSRTRTSPPSPESPRFPRTSSPYVQEPIRAPGPPRMASAPAPVLRPSSATSVRSATAPPPPSVSAQAPSPTPSASRPPPVSILKQPARSTSDPAQPTTSAAGRSPMLSALPKHMQLQAGMSVKPPVSAAEARMAPIAKMFVECCNCKFYHDMPSKLYECMAKPDAVVEDRLLGISGAITTSVKCPWCQHNMTTSCCAGYAAVVYLKEKMH